MASTKRTTLKDIAELAKVSTGTVSMVLNNNPLVAEDTREHVLRVIRESDYVYDRRAAQLRTGRSSIVGGAVCNLLNPYFAEVAAGMEAALDSAGQRLVLGNASESVERQERFLETLREYNVDGILWMPSIGTKSADVRRVLEWGTPVVMVTRYVSKVEVDYIGTDNRLASVLATEHLIELGHRRIAFLGADARTSSGHDRMVGYRASLKKAGLPLLPEYEVKCEATREDAFHGIQTLFTLPEPPTAVVCFNDFLAFGAMLGLQRLGLEPGRDCSVVGMDDMREAALWQPTLTTVAIDADGIGRGAVELLAQRMKNPQAPVQRVLFTPRLVVRESCAPPPPESTLKPAEKRRRAAVTAN
jgi:LacI family transcriptional regulator